MIILFHILEYLPCNCLSYLLKREGEQTWFFFQWKSIKSSTLFKDQELYIFHIKNDFFPITLLSTELLVQRSKVMTSEMADGMSRIFLFCVYAVNILTFKCWMNYILSAQCNELVSCDYNKILWGRVHFLGYIDNHNSRRLWSSYTIRILQHILSDLIFSS